MRKGLRFWRNTLLVFWSTTIFFLLRKKKPVDFFGFELDTLKEKVFVPELITNLFMIYELWSQLSLIKTVTKILHFQKDISEDSIDTNCVCVF